MGVSFSLSLSHRSGVFFYYYYYAFACIHSHRIYFRSMLTLSEMEFNVNGNKAA